MQQQISMKRVKRKLMMIQKKMKIAKSMKIVRKNRIKTNKSMRLRDRMVKEIMNVDSN
jgi:hypothetical protein